MVLNVAMLSTWKVRCGIASYSENLARALAKQDVNVYVVRIPRFGEKEISIFQNILDRIPVDKVDVIHVQHEYGLYGRLNKEFFPALAKLGKPVVTTMHATGFGDDAVIEENSSKIIVHNEYCRERFGGTGVKVATIPHGMTPLQTPLPPKDVCKRRLGIQPEVPIVGYLGYISEYKGLEMLIDAMVDVPKAGLLLGGGWFYEQDTTYIMSLKERTLELLPSRCQWIGFVPDEDLAMTYGAMDVVVYPSRFMTESGALLTALSHGKAVVASNLAPVREKSNALMIFKDKNDLSEKIKLLILNKETRESMEANATRFTLENSWIRVAERHKELYSTICKVK